jgi:hypothetical protein
MQDGLHCVEIKLRLHSCGSCWRRDSSPSVHPPWCFSSGWFSPQGEWLGTYLLQRQVIYMNAIDAIEDYQILVCCGCALRFFPEPIYSQRGVYPLWRRRLRRPGSQIPIPQYFRFASTLQVDVQVHSLTVHSRRLRAGFWPCLQWRYLAPDPRVPHTYPDCTVAHISTANSFIDSERARAGLIVHYFGGHRAAIIRGIACF